MRNSSHSQAMRMVTMNLSALANTNCSMRAFLIVMTPRPRRILGALGHGDLVSDGRVFQQRRDVTSDQPVKRDAILKAEAAKYRAGFTPVVTGPVLDDVVDGLAGQTAVITSVSTKLRISPQSSYNAKVAGTAQGNTPDAQPPWEWSGRDSGD